MRRVISFVGSAVMLASVIALRLLDSVQRLDYLKSTHLSLYTWLTSPSVELTIGLTGLFTMIVGIREWRRFNRQKIATREMPILPVNGTTGTRDAESAPQPASGPLLTFANVTTIGLDNVGVTVGSYGVYVTNSQQRFKTVARNVKVTITFTHNVLAEERCTITGLWFDESPYGKSYSPFISIGMSQAKFLLLLFQDSTRHFYYAATWPPEFFENNQLEYGDWTAEVMLLADNAKARCEYKLMLDPIRGVIPTPGTLGGAQ